MIQCPNYSCQALNADGSQFCHQCQAPLPRRWLWAVGQHTDAVKPGMLVAERYLCQASRIFLDTQPGLPPGTLSELPEAVLPYLHLISHQIHLPQVYGWADVELSSGNMTRLMFLENGALLTTQHSLSLQSVLGDEQVDASSSVTASFKIPRLLPSLKTAWPSGSATQQLHWLWQIAQLWSPLFHEHVASTLMIDEFIRVEGPLIRLVQLQYWRPDWDAHLMLQGNLELTQPFPCTLEQLGKNWAMLVPHASSDIQSFLGDLCHHLTHQMINDVHGLLSRLEQAMTEVEQCQTITLRGVTQTDQGPSRSNNEDACFPTSGKLFRVSPSSLSPGDDKNTNFPIVVCDGIGGHHGGDIASNLAIDTIVSDFQPFSQPAVAPTSIENALKQVVAQANDAISQVNDHEKRRDRQRMGTTLVMAWSQGRNCYITHVGDSRAYWVTSWGCHQITLDDDVASREVRLGYGTYRSVLYHPNSGALVQALGMGTSQNLYTTVQRLVLEGQGLLLLCSDGLSDQDLIDVCWESILLPVLNGQVTDLELVSRQLVDAANTYNGHDNVTVGLLQWKTTLTRPLQLSPMSQLDREHLTAHEKTSEIDSQSSSVSTDLTERLNSAPTRLVAPRVSHSGETSSELRSVHHVRQPFNLAEQEPVIPYSSSQSSSSPAKGTNDTTISSKDNIDRFSSQTAVAQPARTQSALLAHVACLLGIGVLLSIGGALTYLWIPAVQQSINRFIQVLQPKTSHELGQGHVDKPELFEPLPPSNPQTPPLPPALAVGSVITLKVPFAHVNSPSLLDVNGRPRSVILFERPPAMSESTFPNSDSSALQELGVVPWGSILNVKGVIQVSQPTWDRQALNRRPSGDGRWLQVQLCFIPSGPDSNLSSGVIGWVKAQHLDSLVQMYEESSELSYSACPESSGASSD